MLRLFICLGCAMWFALPAWGYTPKDTALLKPTFSQKWLTLETEHFLIHYRNSHLSYAQRMAAVAEKVYARQTPRFDWQPADKVQVVISDSFDGSNGGATVLPYNQFFIFMSAPTKGELLDNSPWMEQVFTHEFVHILHLDQSSGTQTTLRTIFGRFFFVFPQIFSPAWVTEGMAVYEETDEQKRFGRGQSALYDAMMRAEYGNGFRSFTELSYQGSWGTDWPGSQSYLYGYYFFEFLTAQYGEEKAFEYLRNWNANIIPWRMQSRAKKVFGLSAESLWSEYVQYLDKKFAQEMAGLPQPDYTELVSTGRINSNPRWISEGDFYYYREDGRHHPALQRIDPTGAESEVAEIEKFIQVDVHPQAGVLLSRYAVCDNVNVYADLYRLNKKGRWDRITRCGRYPRIAWSHSAERIAAVHVNEGIAQIALLDPQGTLQQQFKPLAEGEVIGEINWSPDDSRLVAAVYRARGGWNLELLDLNTGHWSPLTNNTHLEQRPRFSADGKSVYFLSDQGNVWNLRRLILATGRIETVTRTQTAILDYSVEEASGRTRVAEYTANGVMLREQKIKPWGDTYAGLWQQRAPVESIENQPAFDAQQFTDISDYSPLPTVLPTSWFAMLYADSEDNSLLQFYLAGQDVLGFHAWEFAPAYYLEKNELGGSASYVAYHRLALFAEREYDTIRTSGNGVLGAWREETRFQALWMQPFNSFDGTFQVDLGAGHETVNRIIEDFGQFDSYSDNLGGISFNWSDYEYYVHSISPEDGRRIRLEYEEYNVFGGGFHKGGIVSLDWREYISLFDNHVLALRAVFGKGDSDAKPFQLGNEQDELQSLGGRIGFGYTGYTLRGYGDNEPRLAGNNLSLYSAEYRLPLRELFDGFSTFPVGLGKIGLTAFIDHGAAWEEGTSKSFYTGVGVELSPELLVGYSTFRIESTLGFAQGLDSELGESVVYLRLGAEF
ncbi:MAG: hypothetical protein D6160_19780 [Ketobacter sp.]|nr:MAG: hypothetical protein D6160_19780 [Ketobacter sp.]